MLMLDVAKVSIEREISFYINILLKIVELFHLYLKID